MVSGCTRHSSLLGVHFRPWIRQRCGRVSLYLPGRVLDRVDVSEVVGRCVTCGCQRSVDFPFYHRVVTDVEMEMFLSEKIIMGMVKEWVVRQLGCNQLYHKQILKDE